MSFKIRHQGSPKQLEGLSQMQILTGLQDGQWEFTDEVMGPQDKRWIPLETHPQFEEQVEELQESMEPIGEVEDPEEQRIDMNPLIDVCLVLLIFFILATSMRVMEKVLDIPQSKVSSGATVVRQEDAVKIMIMLKVSRGPDGQPVIRIEARPPTPLDDLQRQLDTFVTETRKTEMAIEATGVDWGTIVTILDAAGGAKIHKVHFVKTSGGGAPAPAP